MSSSYIGKVVDNYRIIENIGVGGMGVVFKAIHIKLDKLFALKMIAPGMAMNENFIKRFQTEAKALAKFEDPNTVRIYDLREYNDQWFIVMEFVEGYNLLDIIRKEGAFPLQNALSILKQILTAIGHAHSAGIIHRDLKPSNVMISADGRVKITDFGLAKDQTSMATTLSVTSGGTLYYMSPEHVKGFQFTDKRSDIYSIGMTFYEMITGTVPFKDLQSDFDIRESIIRKKTQKPSAYIENIPAELESIIMKSIAKDPDDRYQSTEEMIKAIYNFEKKDPAIDSDFALVEIPETTVTFLEDKKSDISPLSALKNILSVRKGAWSKVGIVASLITIISILFYFYYSPFSNKEAKNDQVAELSHFSISSEPSSALILIGSDSIGHTPINNHSLQPGKYPLIISKNNYHTIDTTIILNPGNNVVLSLSLKPVDRKEEVILSKTSSEFISKPPVKRRDQVSKKTVMTSEITIDSEPKAASVWIDEQLQGTTPLNLSSLSPGNHQLFIKKDGFTDYQRSIKLKSGRNDVHMATLEALTGAISVITDPPSALLLLDGQEISNSPTPANLEKVPIGKHKLEIRKKGYALKTKEIEVKLGEITHTNFSLVRLEGRLSVQVRPWGSIYIDDELKKESADTKYEVTLPVEQYKVKVSHPTLGLWEKIIHIEPDAEKAIVVNFIRKIKVTISAFDERGLPLNARIYIDDKDTGKLTPAEIKTPVGIHKLELKIDGYSSANSNKEIFVDKNEQNEFTIILKNNQ